MVMNAKEEQQRKGILESEALPAVNSEPPTEGSLGDLEVSRKKAREMVLQTGRGRVLEKGTQTQRPWIHSLQGTGGTGAVSNGEG